MYQVGGLALTPDMQVVWCCLCLLSRVGHVEEIAVNVMLENEAGGIKPIAY